MVKELLTSQISCQHFTMQSLGRFSGFVRSLCVQRLTPLNYSPNLQVNILRQCSQKAANEETTAKVEDSSKKGGDRTKVIPVETSIKYLKSSAYKESYGDYLVWEQYRRNHKGPYPPPKTRKTCVRKGVLSTGNPCPICRDEYLVLHHQNIDLLKQFISPQSGEVLKYSKTGICRKRHQELLIAVERARDYGLLTFDVPFREYDYSEYYSHLKKN